MARRRKAAEAKHGTRSGRAVADVRAAYEQCVERGIVAEDVRIAAVPSAGDRAYAAYVARVVAGRYS